MNEKLRKTLLYLQPIETYWKLTDKGSQKYALDAPFGFYPLSFRPRIDQGHYQYFDDKGIPCFPNFSGIMVHHFTTMSSYSFGNWEYYLQTGNKDYAQRIIAVADFMAGAAIPGESGAALLLDYEDESEESGIPCAMNQGEGISVLCRAYYLSGNDQYLALAKQLAKAFELEYGKGGVAKTEPDTGKTWFLEGGKFILNGHNYCLFGLHELYKASGEEQYFHLFKKGYDSVLALLPAYDTGYWSYYWIHHTPYTASIMYHNLHIAQLRALHDILPDKQLDTYIRKFKKYAANPVNRLRAAMDITLSKLGRRG